MERYSRKIFRIDAFMYNKNTNEVKDDQIPWCTMCLFKSWKLQECFKEEKVVL